MTMRRKTVTAIALAMALALPGTLHASSDEPLKVSGTEALRGSTSVAIGAFNVGFIFESTDQTKATGGLMGAFGGATKAKSTLVGVTPEMMQQVADAAYADFVTQLTAKGFTVQAPELAFNSEQLARTEGQASPLEVNIALEKGSKGKATFVKPAALPRLLLIPGDFTGSGLSSMGLNMAAGRAQGSMSAYARAASVPVIDVVYLIDFSDQKRPGAFSFGGLAVNANLSVTPNYSRMTILGANGKTTTVSFRQGVSVDGDFIQQEDVTGGAAATTQAAANVAGGVAAAFGIGGLRFGKTKKFEFTAKPGNYEQGATKAASLTNEQLANLMATLR